MTRGIFFSLLGTAVKHFEFFFVVKLNSRKVGYQGVSLNNLAQFNNQTVKDWAHCKLAAGTCDDIMTKEDV